MARLTLVLNRQVASSFRKYDDDNPHEQNVLPVLAMTEKESDGTAEFTYSVVHHLLAAEWVGAKMTVYVFQGLVGFVVGPDDEGGRDPCDAKGEIFRREIFGGCREGLRNPFEKARMMLELVLRQGLNPVVKGRAFG